MRRIYPVKNVTVISFQTLSRMKEAGATFTHACRFFNSKILAVQTMDNGNRVAILDSGIAVMDLPKSRSFIFWII